MVPARIDPDALWVALWDTCAPNWQEFDRWLNVLVWYRWGEA